VYILKNLAVFQQIDFQARFEWGREGVRALAPVSDIVVIIDALSFTTCVDVVLNRGGLVFPYPYKDATAQDYARKKDAILAGKRGEPISLSPASLSTIERGTRIVLPSPNGATCSFLAKETHSTVVAACLRNASAVANYIKQHGGTVAVIASGERWPDGSLRPSFEDMIAAGAILGQLESFRLSPEARTAIAAFQMAKDHLRHLLETSCSGQELIAMGYSEDVAIASEWNASHIVPVLNEEGAYTCLEMDGGLSYT
jgi:2-phosphosulfolactate phosphatase